MSIATAEKAASQERPAKNTVPSPARLFPPLLLFTSMLIVGRHVRARQVLTHEWPAALTVLLTVLGIAGFVWLWHGRKGVLASLSSSSFAVAILTLLALATALGTFVLQRVPPPGAPPVGMEGGLSGALFLHDLFRSWWYGGLLSLLALSLLLTVMRRPFWRAHYWGFALAHTGLCVTLLGGILGRWYGEEGQLPLRVGAVSDAFMILQRGHPTQRLRQLDFALRLESFDIDKHPRLKPPNLTVYRNQEANESMERVRTTTVSEPGVRLAIPGTDLTVSVREYYPDARIERTFEDSADPRLPAAAQVRVTSNGRGEACWLIEGYGPTAHLHSLELDLEWGGLTEGAWALRTKEARPARHWMAMSGRTEPIEVKVGETYQLPNSGARFKVTDFFPAFSYDIENKRAYTTSEEPLRPALQIEILDGAPGTDGPKTQFLFSGEQGHMDRGNALNLMYGYEPAAPQIPQIIRLDVRAARYALARDGRPVAEGSFETGKAVEIAGTGEVPPVRLEILESLAHARPHRIAQTQSQEPREPAAFVELLREGDDNPLGSALLEGEQKWVQLNDDLMLMLEAYEQEVKSFRSHVSVLRNGQVERQATIIVNEPLTVDGYTFYQNDYRPNDPTFSGLRVVSDPGLGLAYLGMILVSLGMTYTLYIRPRLRKTAEEKESTT